MKIAIIGTGAMGSVYAGVLAEAGHEIWAIDEYQNNYFHSYWEVN